MNKFSSYLLLVSMFFLYSCSTKKIEEELKNDSLIFEVGYYSNPALQGIYSDNNTKVEEIYFVKDTINPRILFFETLSGSISDSINLHSLEKTIGKISKVSIINKDSIILMSSNSNTVVGIDRNCNIHFKHNIKDLIEEVDNIYSFYPTSLSTSIHTSTHNNHSLILGSYWKKSKAEKPHRTPYDEYIDHYRTYCKSPQLIKIDNIYDEHPSVSWGLSEYFTDKIESTVKPYFEYNILYYLFKDKILYTNYYDRNIHILDGETMEVEESHVMIPKTLNLLTSLKFKGEIDPNDAILEKENRKNSNYVCNVLYSNKDKEYYIFIKTGIDTSETDEKGYSFSIMVYSETFEFKKELKFDTDNYLPYKAVLSSQGILIETIESQSNSFTRVFDIIKIKDSDTLDT